MKSDTARVPKRLSKASKHARLLRASLEQLLRLLPEAHDMWRTMAQETRQIELRIDAIHAILEELMHRDPAVYATLLLLPEEGGNDTLDDPSKPFDA